MSAENDEFREKHLAEGYERGWKMGERAGYQKGEMERVALATANGDLRSELQEMKRIAISSRAQAAKFQAAVCRGNAMIADLQAQLAEYGWTPAG